MSTRMRVVLVLLWSVRVVAQPTDDGLDVEEAGAPESEAPSAAQDVPSHLNLESRVGLLDWRLIEQEAAERREAARRRANPRAPAAADPRPRSVGGEPRFFFDVFFDVETLVGQASSDTAATYASTLLRARGRVVDQLRFGITFPFVVGSYRECWMFCGADSYQRRAFIGNLALDVSWEARAGQTRFPVGLLIALPTAWQDEYLSAPVAVTRGYEDDELFNPGRWAVVPRVGVEHLVGRFELGVSAKLPIAVRMPRGESDIAFPAFQDDSATLVDVVFAAQAMARVVDRPSATLSLGARVVVDMFLTWPSWPFHPDRAVKVSESGVLVIDWREAFFVTLEPRVQAQLGGFLLRASVLFPFGVDTMFPHAWGMRLGVGYEL